MQIAKLRQEYHKKICDQIIRFQSKDAGNYVFPNFADGSNTISVTFVQIEAESPKTAKKQNFTN